MATETLDILVRLRNLTGRSLAGIEKGLKGVGTAAIAVGKSLTGMQAKLVALGTTFAAGAFGATAIRTFTEFDDTMRAVGAVTGATAEEFELLTKTAKEMGKTTRFSASQAADGLRLLGMAGFEAHEASEALPGVLNLAAAGGLELGQAADIATNILAGFNLEVNQLNSVNDVLVKTFTSTNSTLVELGEAFKLVGPIAAGVGADFEDLVASLGKLHDAGLKGTLAGTGLRGALDALLNPTAEEAKLMKDLQSRLGGVALQVRDAEGNFIGFAKIIEQLEKAGLRGDEALKLFGLRAGPGIAALLGQGFESLEDFTEALKDAGYTSDEIASLMEAGIGGASREMAAAFEAVQIAFGEAFNDDVVKIIRQIRDWLLELVKTIERLHEEGKIQEWAKTAKESIEVLWGIVRKVGEAFNLLGKQIALVAAATHGITSGDFGAFKAAFADVVESQKEFWGVQEKTIQTFYGIGEAGEVVYKRQVDMTEDLKKRREEELKHTEDIEKRRLDYIKNRQQVDEAAQRGAIGRSKKAAKDIVTVEVGPSAEATAKAEFVKLQAIIDREMVELDSRYELGRVQLEEYFSERKSLVQEAVESEIGELKRAYEGETDADKRLAIDAKIFDKRQDLAGKLVQIEAERIQEVERLEAEQLKKQEALNDQKLAIAQVFNDQWARLQATQGEQLQTQFAKEIADLQERQNREMQILRDAKATEAQINELHRQQEMEKERVAFDQYKRLQEARLEVASGVAGSLSTIFDSVYELSGKKSKEFFYLAKAAAIAEATINIAQGITKALAQGGAYGAIMGAAVAAAGAVQIAKISSTTFAAASGGEVPGWSPNDKADNIPARLTAGEWVQPVSTVKYYGKATMEAIRKKLIPREILAGFGMPGVPTMRRGAFATGGGVAAGAAGAGAGGAAPGEEKVNINNFIDPALFSQHVQSTAGERDVMNVLTRNQFKLKQMVFSE